MSRKTIAFLLALLALGSLLAMSVSAADVASAESAAKEQPIGLVIAMGLGVVFFGLICIVLLSMIMSAIVRAVEKKVGNKDGAKSAPVSAAPAASELSPEKRRELIAAVSAVVAEELGTDVSAIRVTSFKRV